MTSIAQPVPTSDDAARSAPAERRLQFAMAAWEAAPPPVRATLLERLLEPLGPLARLAVASGAFAAYLAREHAAHVNVRWEDAASFRGDQVLELARFALDVQPDALQGLVSGPSAQLMGAVGLATALLVALWRR